MSRVHTVSHPCDECRVEASFQIKGYDHDTKISGSLVDENGDIEYWREVRCVECGTVSTHGGVYQIEWR
jgi:hypothetical protein